MQRSIVLVALCMLIGCNSAPKQQGSQPYRGAVKPSPELAAEAVEPAPKVEPLSAIGNHSPYRVLGKTYTVLASAQGYVERGKASWYGPNFHGRLTSNQEVFDMHKLTAAHRSLPLPSYVQVTNLDNQRQVVVRVNDRGPFKDGRIIDLSYAAALKLGMIEQGIGNVEVRAIGPTATEPRPAVSTAQNVYLQLGAFSSRDNALLAMRKLPWERVHVTSDTSGEKVWHRLRIGPLSSADEAEQLKPKLAELGFAGSQIVFE